MKNKNTIKIELRKPTSDDGAYYLVATMEDKIVGTIWYGKTGDLICVG